MIILSNTSDKLQVVLGSAITTNQLQCTAFWRDITTTTFVPGRSLVVTNNTTDVDVVESPGSSTQRLIDFLTIYNSDTVNATVIVKIDDSSNEFILWKGILGVGEMLQYNDKTGFTVTTVSGAIKQAQLNGSVSVAINSLNVNVLAEDVVNNNATANTMADVTGLSFPVVAGETYWFEFVIPYTSAATTTGSRWSIDGPASPAMLNYRSEYTLTATSVTNNCATSYNVPTACNASSLTTGNVATIWGYIKPTTDGAVIARFASEVSNSAITAKAGAMVRWIRVI